MNCLEFRQCVLQNPMVDDAALKAHRHTCVGCKAFAAELLQQEKQLQQALNVTVPPRLAERVLLTTNLRKPRWQPYAIAAALFLTVMITGTTYWQTAHQSAASWSEIVLAHVLNEREKLYQEGEYSLAELRQALAGFGLTVQSGLGRIQYLGQCEMPGGKGLHLVIETAEAGQVTVIIPPKGTIAEHSSSAREGFAATFSEVDSVAIGIVTNQPNQLGHLQHWLEQEWHAT